MSQAKEAVSDIAIENIADPQADVVQLRELLARQAEERTQSKKEVMHLTVVPAEAKCLGEEGTIK